MKPFRPSEFVYQFFLTWMMFPKVWGFIREQRLWVGLNRYGWATKMLVVAGALLGLKLWAVFSHWLGRLHGGGGNQQMGFASLGALASDLGKEAGALFSVGYMKYVVFILLQVVAYHFMRGTVRALTGRETGGEKLDDFIRAQVRSFKVGLLTWVLELVATIMVGIFFGIVGVLDGLEPAAKFLIQCYFLGFMVLDVYHEIQGLPIRESERHTRRYFSGVALALGLPLYVMMMIPLVGPVAGVVMAAVAGGMVMSRV